MHYVRSKRALYAAGTSFLVGGSYLAWIAATSPLRLPAEKGAPKAETPAPREATPRDLPSDEEISALHGRAYRVRLFDSPPEPPKPPPPKRKKPLPKIRLMGTVISSSKPLAMVALGGGPVEFRRVGDVIGPPENSAEITGISADRITLRHEGREVDVKRDEGRGRR